MTNLDIESLLIDFINQIETGKVIISSNNNVLDKINADIRIYNEYSLVHELVIYLRKILPKKYKIEFERNENCFSYNLKKQKDTKHEIDIVIYNDNLTEKYAIEVKFPRQIKGGYTNEMWKLIEDIKFMEYIKKTNKFKKTFCLTLTDNYNLYKFPNILTKNITYSNLHKIFRVVDKNENNKIYGIGEEFKNNLIYKSFKINLDHSYQIEWTNIKNNPILKYYLIKIK